MRETYSMAEKLWRLKKCLPFSRQPELPHSLGAEVYARIQKFIPSLKWAVRRMLKLLISFFLGKTTCQLVSAPNYNEHITPSTVTWEVESQVRFARKNTQMLVFVFGKKGKEVLQTDCRVRLLLFFHLTLKTACKPYLNKVPRQTLSVVRTRKNEGCIKQSALTLKPPPPS